MSIKSSQVKNGQNGQNGHGQMADIKYMELSEFIIVILAAGM